ncbi:MAG: DUF975 family protein [Eubacterium sp.]|nr:DUF975 family protein [Eubacterium sp.]
MNNWTIGGLKAQGKGRFKANYWKAVLVGLVASIVNLGVAGFTGVTSGGEVSTGFQPGARIREMALAVPKELLAALLVVAVLALITVLVIAIFLRALLINPLEIGCKRFYLRNLIEDADVKEICYTYDRGYKNGVTVLFYRDLYMIGWILLLVIPAVFKYYEYRMIPFIMAEKPDTPKEQAFAMSKEMMRGNKWRAFLLDLSFILWDILGVVTFGLVGIFYVTPYKNSTDAALYQAVRLRASV